MILGKLYVLDHTINAEDFHYMVFIDGSGKSTDVNFGGAGGWRAAAPLSAI